MDKKILVAVDGSYCSQNVIRYLARVFSDYQELTVHLICMVTGCNLPPESPWLTEQDRLAELSTESKRKIHLTQKHLREESGFLTHHGFAESQVTAAMQFCQSNVAAELISELEKGRYDALVIGRRGLGKLQELVLGSVTTTILEKCFHVPIWIIDGEIDSRSFLVPVDGSWRTLKAVDHLAFMLGDVADADISLFHSTAWLASKKPLDLDRFCEIWGEQWCDEHLSRSDAVFHAPEQILRESGVDMSRVHRVEERRGPDAALDIIFELHKNRYGTIVMGRRGPQEPKGIFGGVSSRVLRTVNNVAVWLVN